jgi:hypothetical protein
MDNRPKAGVLGEEEKRIIYGIHGRDAGRGRK